MFRREEKFRVNGSITASEVCVVDDTGVMLGVMPCREAVAVADGKGLDLVEIAPKSSPPTCKIMDYGRWKFKKSKKAKNARKNQVKVIVKEVQIRPRTDAHDLEIKIRKAKNFLMNGCKVKIHLRYSGREMAHKELGIDVLKSVIKKLEPFSILEKNVPQMEKRSAFLFFSPNPVKVKEFQRQKKKQVSEQKDKENVTPASSSQESSEKQESPDKQKSS